MTQIWSSGLSGSALNALGTVAQVLLPGDEGYAASAATLVYGEVLEDLAAGPERLPGAGSRRRPSR